MRFPSARATSQLFIFLPWPLFLSQGNNLIQDYSKLRIGFSKATDCSQVHKVQTATIAYSDEAKQKGLSGRKKPLKHDESMIFIYDQPIKLAFWMKETYIPLQIAYFDSRGMLINLLEMPVEKNPSEPTAFYLSSRPGIIGVEMSPDALTREQSQVLCVEVKAKSSGA